MVQSSPRTLLELLDERCSLAPAQAAFYWNDEPYTFEWLGTGARRFAALLAGGGIAPGDRVLIRLGNGPEFFEAFYGTLRAGAIAVPLFPSSGPERVASLAERCGARMLVDSEPGSGEVGGLKTVSVAESQSCSPDVTFPAVGAEDVAFLQYTSGSTGTPKGVMLTHDGLLTNVRQLIEAMRLTRSDCFVSWLPVYHDMGLILMTMVPFYLGARLILLPTALANPRPWLAAITRYHGTVTAAPDFGYRLVLRHVREPGGFDLSSLRVALNAAEPVRPSTIAAFERAFGLRNVLIAGYGLAEATVGVSTWTTGSPPLVDSRGVVSVGRPFSGIDVRITGDGEPLATGEIGEVVVHSPANTRGYYNDPAGTAGLFWRDGYIKTGDLGYLDDEGRLFITGRLKNIIKHGGETIFPQEAEETVDRLPFVRRSAALGIDSGGPEGEQLYMFAEVSRPGAQTMADLYDRAVEVVQAIHGRLGMRPARVYLVRPHAIPITPNGKTQHAALRDLYLSGTLRQAILFPDY
jgi:acyl-CoA synthetase (AMP-forming)/AMP-acid ligase II